jgi:hypothetical protein
MRNAGNMPMKNSREVDRAAVARSRGWSIDEVNSAAQAFKALYRRQPQSTVTFEWYLNEMEKSGIRPRQIGKSRGAYQLARIGDCGAYVPGNCRFLPSTVNHGERDFSYMASPTVRSRITSAANLRERLQCEKCGERFTPGMLVRWHGPRCKKAQT